jgi:hypothetical protein
LGVGWRVAFVTFGFFGRQKLLTLWFFYPLLCLFLPFLTVFEKYWLSLFFKRWVTECLLYNSEILWYSGFLANLIFFDPSFLPFFAFFCGKMLLLKILSNYIVYRPHRCFLILTLTLS